MAHYFCQPFWALPLESQLSPDYLMLYPQVRTERICGLRDWANTAAVIWNGVMSKLWVSLIWTTSSTPQGGGGSFKNRKPIGKIRCCESGMAEPSHWWIEKWLISLTLSLSFSDYLPTYLIYLSMYLSRYQSIYFSLSLSLSLSSNYLSIYLSIYLSVCLSIYLSFYLSIYPSIYLSPSFICLSV